MPGKQTSPTQLFELFSTVAISAVAVYDTTTLAIAAQNSNPPTLTNTNSRRRVTATESFAAVGLVVVLVAAEREAPLLKVFQTQHNSTVGRRSVTQSRKIAQSRLEFRVWASSGVQFLWNWI